MGAAGAAGAALPACRAGPQNSVASRSGGCASDPCSGFGSTRNGSQHRHAPKFCTVPGWSSRARITKAHTAAVPGGSDHAEPSAPTPSRDEPPPAVPSGPGVPGAAPASAPSPPASASASSCHRSLAGAERGAWLTQRACPAPSTRLVAPGSALGRAGGCPPRASGDGWHSQKAPGLSTAASPWGSTRLGARGCCPCSLARAV